MSISAAEPSQSKKAKPNAEDLSTAFETFNQVSAQLADSYQAMEQQVGQLNAELHQVAEQRLHELKEKERLSNRLENLLHLLPAGVVVLDSRGVVNECNPAAIDLLGEPLQGQLWREVILRSFAPQKDDGHEISLRDGRRISMITRSLQGEPGQLILLTDLTETRQLQQRLNRHRRLSEMGRMMSSLAHQIRTPLSAAMLYAGHLVESDLSAEQVERFSQKVLSRLNHLDQQVKDMLIFVKGDVKLTHRLTVRALLDELSQALEAPLKSSGCQLRVDSELDEGMLHCNLESMVGVLMNLINNAIQSQQQPVQIDISCRALDEHTLQIGICDNGPGIEPEVLQNLQEPFFTTKAQGTGLGLTVVRTVVQAHHGRFELLSEPGKGSCAVIELPLIEADDAEDSSL